MRRHLEHLHFLDVAADSGPPDWTCVIYHRTDELLVEQHTVSDGQTASSVREGPGMPSLRAAFYRTWLTCSKQVR
jgi:hypothetical protein